MRLLLVRFLLIAGAAASFGCSSRSPATAINVPPSPPSTPEASPPVLPEPAPPAAIDNAVAECQLIPPQEQTEGIATVALPEPVDAAHAPHPENESERLLFRSLYETLIRVDCRGRAQPQLASSWTLARDGETWLVTLRENARFADGIPVTADQVLLSWANQTGELKPRTQLLVRTVTAVDERTLAITLAHPRADAPLTLGHPDLAVVRRENGMPWPIGTREAVAEANPSTITVGNTQFRLAASRDPRDLLDEGIDLLITREPRVLDYASTLAQFQIVDLEWQRTHVFLSRWRNPTAPVPSLEAREELSRDAVRGEARGAQEPFWWQQVANCDFTPKTQPPPAMTSGRIVYREGDDVARDLAERLVGLAGATPAAGSVLAALFPNDPPRIDRAAGLRGQFLAAAHQRGEDSGYILEVMRRPLDACREIHVLAEGVGWIDPATIAPLVDSRMRAIVRRGRGGLVAEWNGPVLSGRQQ